MTKCLHVDVRPVEGLCSCVESRNGLGVEYRLTNGCAARIKLMVTPVNDLGVDIDYRRAIALASVTSCNVPVFVKVQSVCWQILPTPYLEISPEIIWVYPDWAVENEVFSNTDWNIN